MRVLWIDIFFYYIDNISKKISLNIQPKQKQYKIKYKVNARGFDVSFELLSLKMKKKFA